MSHIRPIALLVAGATLATALTLTGIEAFNVGAAPGDTDTTYVPVEPCRLLDTRASATQGDRRAPLGPGETYTAQVTGTNGDCVGIPTTASAVALNVTSIGPTAQSFLTVFPGDVTAPPQVSNLNWVAGQPPTPNKVDVKLSPDGKIKLFNAAGTVNIAIDVAGYYTASSLVSLQTEVEGLRADVDLLRAERPIIVRSSNTFVEVGLTGDFTQLSGVSVNAPAAGRVYVHAQGTAVEFDAGEDVHCTVQQQFPTATSSRFWPRWEASGPTGESDGEGDSSGMSVSNVFDVEPGVSSFFLYCKNTAAAGESEFWGPQIFAVYVPN